MGFRDRVMIVHNFRIESVSSLSYHLAHHLSLNHEVIFISYRPFFKERRILLDGRLTVYSWSTRARPTGIRDVFHFMRIFFRHRPGIVIAHFVGANISIPVSKFLSLFRVRTFEWYHTLSTQLSHDGGRMPRWLKMRRWLMFRYFSDTVVPVSDMAARDYRAFYGLGNCRVVLNAIRDEYRGVETDFGSAPIQVGFIGRLLPHKGLDILSGLIEALPADQFVFRIAGEGPGQAEIARRSGSNVEFAGLLPYELVFTFIEGCDVVVIPSYTDALVMVGVETLMMKRCLVISNGTGLSEYLRHREDAWVCEPSRKAFLEALLLLHADRALMGRLASGGRKTFLDQFCIEAHIRNVERLILSR